MLLSLLSALSFTTYDTGAVPKKERYLTDRFDGIFEVQNAQKSKFSPLEELTVRAYIVPLDLVAGGEGTRGPLRNYPTSILGPSIRPRFYGSQGLTHYRILI